MEKYRDGQRELHCVFADLEKAYDRVPGEELWYCMRKSGVAEKYVRVVQDMYERSRTVINFQDPNLSGFKAVHSTETSLLAITEKLYAARSAKLSSVLILLYLSAAFDTVNHKILLSTLGSLQIRGTAWEQFTSYLDDHSYQIPWLLLGSQHVWWTYHCG
ncbi:hypothetical protein QTP70_008208 [Hemibagrus guttatus]|uniref:Reverse transcriptase domain-containing protein n=1 Tax=Hemibagrus guttatus TaxID=175788 RepID=A0AAE0R7Q8_9TELE|nr:hypothetical protein QTP70_008208 [Hemibagrus guttatus]